MMRRTLGMMIVFAALAAVGARPSPIGSALLPDGSTRTVDEETLATIRSTAWPGWLALQLHLADARETDSRPMATLDDGQRLSGEFDAVGNELRWRHRELGSMQLDLERLAWIGAPELLLEPAPPRDRVRLVNGDRIEGFVNALQLDRGIEIETPSTQASQPPVRSWYSIAKGVSAIQLVPRGHPSSGWRLWFRDGSVVDVDAWQRVGERLVLTGCHLPGIASPVSVPWNSLVAVRDPRQAVQALASGAWAAKDLPQSPRLSPASVDPRSLPGALDLVPCELHGPGLFMLQAPTGRRITMQLEASPNLGKDTDCQVTVFDGDRELKTFAMKGAAQPVRVTDTLASGQLKIRIDAGPRGAYGSTVRVTDGMALDAVTAPAATTPPPPSVPATPLAPAAPAPG